jgi:hypothetical protein
LGHDLLRVPQVDADALAIERERAGNEVPRQTRDRVVPVAEQLGPRLTGILAVAEIDVVTGHADQGHPIGVQRVGRDLWVFASGDHDAGVRHDRRRQERRGEPALDGLELESRARPNAGGVGPTDPIRPVAEQFAEAVVLRHRFYP